MLPYDFQHVVNAKKRSQHSADQCCSSPSGVCAAHHGSLLPCSARRWYGRALAAVLQKEYAHADPAYYSSAIERGLVTVNGRTAQADSIVQSGDLITHSLHRHEPPVSAAAIRILHQDEHIIAVNKPPSIAVHACQYRRLHSAAAAFPTAALLADQLTMATRVWCCRLSQAASTGTTPCSASSDTKATENSSVSRTQQRSTGSSRLLPPLLIHPTPAVLSARLSLQPFTVWTDGPAG